ncbi:hypothetical protein KPH14_010434 [Odynerus spinipes]|uniref:Uncharacterized protein n=1 Tax=Odynerus spinipes TaxID=1348599 RepID=A0AAD9RTX0_9HYME|nr:hypothetical protein KPH14_010434 [Odynerus spinipes]
MKRVNFTFVVVILLLMTVTIISIAIPDEKKPIQDSVLEKGYNPQRVINAMVKRCVKCENKSEKPEFTPRLG